MERDDPASGLSEYRSIVDMRAERSRRQRTIGLKVHWGEAVVTAVARPRAALPAPYANSRALFWLQALLSPSSCLGHGKILADLPPVNLKPSASGTLARETHRARLYRCLNCGASLRPEFSS